MIKGIYCYVDTQYNDKIVYIGKDSNIDKHKRRYDHQLRCNYNRQVINRVIQNNRDRYQYKVLFSKDDCSDNHLNQLEIYFIKKYNPCFNFTNGGEGISGYKMSDKQKDKLSKINQGKVLSIETKQKISNTMKKRNIHKGTSNPMYNKTKELHHNFKKEPRIIKKGFKRGKQVYGIKHNTKIIERSINKQKLEKKLEKIKKELKQ